jgi:hypothetical protein
MPLRQPANHPGLSMKETIAALAFCAFVFIAFYFTAGATKLSCPLNSTPKLTRGGWFCIVPPDATTFR